MAMNKIGVSTVIATVFIVLLTLALGVLIAKFTIPYAKNNLQSSTECVKYDGYFKFQQEIDSINYNCYQSTSGTYWTGFSVRADTGDKDLASNVVGFKILFKESSVSDVVKTLKVGDTASKSSNSVWMAGQKDAQGAPLSITMPGPGEITTYAYNYNKVFSSAEIYPLLKSGRLCDKSDDIILTQCSSAATNTPW